MEHRSRLIIFKMALGDLLIKRGEDMVSVKPEEIGVLLQELGELYGYNVSKNEDYQNIINLYDFKRDWDV